MCINGKTKVQDQNEICTIKNICKAQNSNIYKREELHETHVHDQAMHIPPLPSHHPFPLRVALCWVWITLGVTPVDAEEEEEAGPAAAPDMVAVVQAYT